MRMPDSPPPRFARGEGPMVTFRLGQRAEEILGADSERYPGLEATGNGSQLVRMPYGTAESLLDDARGRADGQGYDSEPGEKAACARLVRTIEMALRIPT